MFTQKMLVSLSVVIFLVCVQMAGNVLAGEFPAPFKIAGLFVSDATNLHFRVNSNNPSAWLCSNGPTNPSWAYINEADSGAKVKIATLMTAYSLGKTVSLVTEGVYFGGDYGGKTYCRILEFSISD